MQLQYAFFRSKVGGWDEEDQRNNREGRIGGIKMHGMYLVIKIWSNIKTSSCFHFVAACQDDLT